MADLCLQYGLFLKGIGLSLQDAIRFFRGEFTRGPVDVDKFDKEYVYGIRYNYGQEGKKVSSTFGARLTSVPFSKLSPLSFCILCIDHDAKKSRLVGTRVTYS